MAELLTGILIGVLLTLAAQRLARGKRPEPPMPDPAKPPLAPPDDDPMSASILFERPEEPGPTQAEIESRLRQNLRVKLAYDEAKIDRLIELEREKRPNASLASLLESAIDRFERENR